jgi:cytochrome c551/c552
MVDDVFFILKKSSSRALATQVRRTTAQETYMQEHSCVSCGQQALDIVLPAAAAALSLAVHQPYPNSAAKMWPCVTGACMQREWGPLRLTPLA